MVYNIDKSVLLEEAKHVGTPYEKGTPLGKINRPSLTKSISDSRKVRDGVQGRYKALSVDSTGDWYNGSSIMKNDAKKINAKDNEARVMSQTSNPKAKVDWDGAAGQQSRLYQSAKK